MLETLAVALLTAVLTSVLARIALDRWGGQIAHRWLEEAAVVALASGGTIGRSIQEIQRGGARLLGEHLDALLRRGC